MLSSLSSSPLPSTSTLKSSIICKLQNKSVEQMNQRIKTQSGFDVDEQIRQFGLMKLVEMNQDYDHKGYFNYQNWLAINREIWGERIGSTAEELWKIVRIVNLGHVIVPTGVVFQLINTLIVDPEESSVKFVLESFLRKNQIKMLLSSIRELRNYKSLKEIVDIYAGREQKVVKKCKDKGQLAHKRLYQQYKDKQNELKHIKDQSISKELKQCSFRPSISKYQPKVLQNSNNTCCIRIHEQVPSMEQSEIFQPFKATAPDGSIFEGSVQNIPGVKKHVERQQLSDFHRKRVQRFLKRPIGTLK